MTCPTEGQLVEDAVNLVLTQYRESPKLLGMIRAALGEVEEAAITTCGIPDFFDIDSAVGDQLTIIGKWLGWPRCHCNGRLRTLFGFPCEPLHEFILAVDEDTFLAIDEDTAGEGVGLGDWAGVPLCDIPNAPVGGFCDITVTWECGGPEYEEWCIEDDDLYRKFLKARSLQLLRDFRRDNLLTALRIMFGDDAFVPKERPGVIIASAGRYLTDEERATLHLYREVLPVAPGVRLDIVGQVPDVPFFGFGDGWGGLCESVWL